MVAPARHFKDTVKARAATDSAFRSALLTAAVDLLLSGDVGTGKAVLRDYINATVGFEDLAEDVGTPSKSLMRMFSAKGIPELTIFSVISSLQHLTGVHLAVRPACRQVSHS
jgi:DNA-binding phage protein